MKKISLFSLVLIALLLSACSFVKEDNVSNKESDKTVQELPQNNNYYENNLEKFSIQYPYSWTLTENHKGFDVLINSPYNDEIYEHVGIAVQKLQKFLSTAEYYEETIAQLKDSLESFKEISAKDFNKGKLNGKQITYEYSIGEHKVKSQQTFLISTENTVYSINYTATKNTFDKYFEGAKLILDSFEINK